jgi:hypothetical protein
MNKKMASTDKDDIEDAEETVDTEAEAEDNTAEEETKEPEPVVSTNLIFCCYLNCILIFLIIKLFEGKGIQSSSL